MERHPQRIAAMGEFEFPEEIIHQIQSLMSDQREAARTTLVSKSWYGAWSTRPNLRFHEFELGERFPQWARKTLQRYEDLNLNIQTFNLRMYKDDSLARELILKAIKLGVIDLTIEYIKWWFDLPDEVLESQTLTRLSVSGCTVDLGRRKKKEIITCSTLKSLTLSGVYVNGDFYEGLIWRFPLIEELTLKQPKRLVFDVGAMLKLHKLKSLRMESLLVFIVDLERRNKPLTSSNLKSLTLSSTLTEGDFSYLSHRFPLLEELTVEGCFKPFLPFYGCTTKLNKLKFLQLVRLNTQDSLTQSELWLQFPCLNTLVIRDCLFKANGNDVIRICSLSLDCVTISSCGTKTKLEFDVPNMRKFKFEGYDVPRLKLKTSSREWESDIRIICCVDMGSASWWCSLKQFVKLMSPSRVSLALYVNLPQLGDQNGYVGDGLAVPVVENLTISGSVFSQVSLAFLNALLQSCGPNFVNIQRKCVRGIEKENVEQFPHLSSLPWNTLLDDSTNHLGEEFVRFQLIQGPRSFPSIEDFYG
ncbi:uncharacterized protein LOC130993035 [Salvia miltiorrhiza]|uniref:uncharacterized protein LOC130993035 n=1 Tax=Salvia miltiorrhiza TaxID=226208 RepID=UPI0025AD7CBB|nr:uncharacterized protein LOC130993035 [Salvia miltiorrhiza]